MFKKSSIKNKFARKRAASSGSSNSSDQEESVVVKSDKKKYNPNVHSTAAIKKSRNRDAGAGSGSSDEDSTEEVTVRYKSKRSELPELPRDMGATAELEIDTQKDRDAQALFKKSQEVNKELEGKSDDGIYRGLNNYAKYYKKQDTAQGNAGSGPGSVGPIRAPTNIRATVRWDYQPDICKDYKETGFCGFGDSCKFLHDRSDYKFGWQLELEEREKAKNGDDDPGQYEIHSDDEDLPFKCFICRKSFVDPIITKCGHYFCEKCALERYRKTARCFVCNKQTNGVFNPAKNLIEKLKLQDECEEEEDGPTGAQQAIEIGGSSEDSD
jgi:RING finger protein 113A